MTAIIPTLFTQGSFQRLALDSWAIEPSDINVHMRDYPVMGRGMVAKNQHEQLLWVFDNEHDELALKPLTAGPVVTELRVGTLAGGREVLLMPLLGGYDCLDEDRVDAQSWPPLVDMTVPFDPVTHFPLFDRVIKHEMSLLTPETGSGAVSALKRLGFVDAMALTWVQRTGDLAALHKAAENDADTVRGASIMANLEGVLKGLRVGSTSIADGEVRWLVALSGARREVDYVKGAFSPASDRRDALHAHYPADIPAHPSDRELHIRFKTNTAAFDESASVRDARIKDVFNEVLHRVTTQGLNQKGFAPLKDLDGIVIGNISLVEAGESTAPPFGAVNTDAFVSIAVPSQPIDTLRGQIDEVGLALGAVMAAVSSQDFSALPESVRECDFPLPQPDALLAFVQSLARLDVNSLRDPHAALTGIVMTARNTIVAQPVPEAFEPDTDDDLEHSA